ncbi:MAG: Ig-like domain-containing protein [Planctomycetota bacterium]
MTIIPKVICYLAIASCIVPSCLFGQSGNYIELIQRGSFEPLQGQEPRLADVFEPGHPCFLSEDIPGFMLPANYKMYSAIPEIPAGVSKWYTITDSVDLFPTIGAKNPINAQDGINVIDLLGTPGAGALNQKIDTIPGRFYIVNFFVSSNQANNPEPLEAFADREFTFFWQGQSILFPGETAPVMNTYDQFTYILQAPEGTNGEIVQIGWGGVVTPFSTLPGETEPLFGALLDNVSVIEVRAFVDATTVNENETSSQVENFVLDNDSGIDRVAGAIVLDSSANVPVDVQGTILADGFPNGRIRWETTDGNPLAFDFLEEQETATIRVRYFTETERDEGRNGQDGPNIVSDQAIWTITIVGTNDAPVATDDCADTVLNGEVSIDVVINDEDVDDGLNSQSVEIVTPPLNGEVNINQDGTVTYIAAMGFSGTDSFQYSVRDNFGVASNTATVEIRVWLGDTNGDGSVDLLDIGPFISVLQSGGFSPAADINLDGVVNLLDVAPFVDLLNSGPCE